jgi:hypothetical protein
MYLAVWPCNTQLVGTSVLSTHFLGGQPVLELDWLQTVNPIQLRHLHRLHRCYRCLLDPVNIASYHIVGSIGSFWVLPFYQCESFCLPVASQLCCHSPESRSTVALHFCSSGAPKALQIDFVNRSAGLPKAETKTIKTSGRLFVTASCEVNGTQDLTGPNLKS